MDKRVKQIKRSDAYFGAPIVVLKATKTQADMLAWLLGALDAWISDPGFGWDNGTPYLFHKVSEILPNNTFEVVLVDEILDDAADRLDGQFRSMLEDESGEQDRPGLWLASQNRVVDTLVKLFTELRERGEVITLRQFGELGAWDKSPVVDHAEYERVYWQAYADMEAGDGSWEDVLGEFING